ncbi:MAG TPA: FtsK/SpoIIIE domain-containing protein [Acidimicrobiales bacterium]|nr:FtsK/SpoIIIE domain-containing protein [Acidimicrobiales bacterium]
MPAARNHPLRWRGFTRRWRTELGLAGAFVALRIVLGAVGGPSLLLIGSVAVVAVAAFVRAARQALLERLLDSRRLRRWEHNLALVAPERTPVPLEVEAYGFGERGALRVAGGATVTELAKCSEALAACFGAKAVRVGRHPDHAGVALVSVLMSDPLARPAPDWPWLRRPTTSLWEPVPLGVSEGGAPISISLPEHNLLLGGEPGAGKSGAINLLVAAAALDPLAQLWLLDGKLVELAAWRKAAVDSAGLDVWEAVELLRRVQSVMDSRYQLLLEAGLRKVKAGSGLHLVVVDELAHYLTGPDKKARDAFIEVLRDLVSRGRAAGIVVVVATQKPGSDVVPTSLRDLFGYRLAMRCSTAAASDTILGSGWATEGYSAASIDPATRGVGYLLHESGVPQLLRTHWLDDDAVDSLATRAARLGREFEDGQGDE